MINKSIIKYFKDNNYKIILCDYFDNLLNNYGADELQDCYCFLNNNPEYITYDDLLNSDYDGNASDSALYIIKSGGEIKYLFVDCLYKFIFNILGI